VDMLAADAHKWLLGPCGAGLMYVRRDAQERLIPRVYGWHNVKCPDFVAQEQIQFRPDARRYEAGTHSLLGIVGLMTAMELALEVGIEAISSELLRKRARLVSALRGKGYSVLSPGLGPETGSGIVSFFRPGKDLSAMAQKLDENGVVASLRADRSGQNYIRVSPHYYNTDMEIERFLEIV